MSFMKRAMFYSILTIGSIFFLTGCGSKIEYYFPAKTIEAVKNKNFEYNKAKEVYVGESMIRVKNYFINRYDSSTMSPKLDFRIHNNGSIDLKGFAAKTYEIMGTTVIEDKPYKILLYADHHRKYENFKLLLDEDNKLSNRMLNGPTNVIMIYDFIIEPREVNFVFSKSKVKKSDILTDKPYLNYEIVFSGITKDTIRLLYREYSPEDMARSTFFQELTYPISTKLIRFRDIKIQMLNVDGEKINFKVID